MVKISKISKAVAVQIPSDPAALFFSSFFDLPALLIEASKASEGVDLAETVFIFHKNVPTSHSAVLAVYLHLVECLSTLMAF